MSKTCKACGECCKWIIIPMAGVYYDRQWVEARDGQIRGAYGLLPLRCKHLRPDNKCELHGDKKPIYCLIFPERPSEALDAIGCRFFKEEEHDGDGIHDGH